MHKKIVEAILAKKFDKARELMEAVVAERVFSAFINEDAQGEAGNDVTSDDGVKKKVAKANQYTESPDDFEDEGGLPDVEYGEVVYTESEITKKYDIDADLAGEEPEDEFEDEGGAPDVNYGEVVYTESEDKEDDSEDEDEDEDESEDKKDDEDEKNEAMIVKFREGYRILDENGDAVVNKTFLTEDDAKEFLTK